MGFGLGDLGGWLLGYDEPPEVKYNPATLGGQFNDIFLAQMFFPELFKFAQAAGSVPGSGGVINALKPFIKSGKDIPTGIDDIDIAALSAALPGMQAQASEAQAQNFQKTYDTFSKIPALAGLFGEAGGNVDSTGALAKIFGDLSGAALGSQASSGFLTDPTKQANTLGPLALQKYQIEQSIQKNAQGQVLGLVGAGGLPNVGLFGQSAASSSPYAGMALQSGGLFGGLNAQGFLSASGQNAANFNAYQMAGLDAQMQGFSMMFGGGGG